MKQSKHAKSSLFLMEMMVVILFFALTSAICVHLFAQSYQTAKHSEALTNGVLQAESAAELYKSTGGDLRQTAELLNAEWSSESGLDLGYDTQWQPITSGKQTAYHLTMTNVQGQLAQTAELLIRAADGSELYRLTVKAYQQGGDRL